MKLAWGLGIAGAVLLHAFVLLFGGLLFPKAVKRDAKIQEVELLSDLEADPKKEKPEEKPPEEPQEVQAETEQPPDPIELTRNVDLAPEDSAPALDAASLSAIEAALNQTGGAGGDFADNLSFASGGRIGGTGKAGESEEKLDSAFSMSEIDQKPRAVFQAAPIYPAEVRSKKLDGVVAVIFVVDAGGKVLNPRVEKSSHPAFEKPAMDAVKQWKFEPGIKAGQRVACKMRVSIRFQPS